MHRVGQHVLVRGLSHRGLTPSYVLSHRKAQWPATLTRYRDEDWAYDRRSGLVVPAIRGGVGWSPRQAWQNQVAQIVFFSQNTTALDSAYTYNSAGDAIGAFLSQPETLTLTDVGVFITGYTGTAANVNDLNFELRNHATDKPGSTLHASASMNPASGTGWKKFTGLSFSMVAGTLYWAIVADADGTGTDFATVLRSISPGALNERIRIQAMVATNGWATAPTPDQTNSSLILMFGSTASLGWPYTNATTLSSTTNRRGFNFSTGLSGDVRLHGMHLTHGNALSNGASIELWESGAGPSGTPTASGTIPLIRGTDGTGATAGFTFPVGAGPVIRARTPFRSVFTFSSASNVVGKDVMGTGADAAVRRAAWGGGDIYYAEANGTTDWANDDVNGMPELVLMFEDLWDRIGDSAIGRRRTDAKTLAR